MPEQVPRDAVEAVLADARVTWFGIRHFSPVCALQVRRVIEAERPVAVLVEGPDDATPIIPWIVHSDSVPPLTVLSTYVDRKNTFGRNGELSASPTTPARYRGWWPVVRYGPEYQALLAGTEVGAEVAFIDAPLRATIPFVGGTQQVVDDRHLSENTYFESLRTRRGLRSFDEFWQSAFEVSALRATPEQHQRAVLLFAWCARHVHDDGGESLRADGTQLREQHMRWHVDQALKRHPEGRVVVVTGAFHAVALPSTKGKRAKAKADVNTHTLVCQHSHRALARLYGMNRLPAWADAVFAHASEGHDRPFDRAATDLLLDVQRLARSRGAAVSTADSIGAVTVAGNLARLRGHDEPTLLDVLDASQMAYVKGDLLRFGAEIAAATREVLVGRKVGTVAPEAGQAPLIADFYREAKRHRIDVSGAHKTVRLDLHKQVKHRDKSALLHRAAFLDLPLFEVGSGRGWRESDAWYKGPDVVTGEGMHLIAETWGVCWTEEVDDRLLELSDRGGSLQQVCQNILLEQLELRVGDAAACTKLLLRAVQMRLTGLFERLLSAVDDAVARDGSFSRLVVALADFVLLHGYRSQLATAGHDRIVATILGVFQQACLRLASVARVSDSDVEEVVDHLQTLARVAVALELQVHGETLTPDRALLVQQVKALAADRSTQPTVRGASYGVLVSLGATRQQVVAEQLDSYLLGPVGRVPEGGQFLEGLLQTGRQVFLGGPRLMRTVTWVLARLDAETFRRLLPDLRRAFTAFIPAELDRIGERIATELGQRPMPDPDAPVPEAVREAAEALDVRVEAVLERWTA